MTSSANEEWNYDKLLDALEILRDLKKETKYAAKSAISHAIDFIEYNMEQSEITGGNGD